MNRETWLELAVTELRPFFNEKGYKLPDNIRVACGFPSSKALSKKGKRLGECWEVRASVDGIHQIYITPLLSDKRDVLSVLTHELIHAALPDKTGHKKGFKMAAHAIGFEEGSVGREIEVGGPLDVRLNALTLPDYPHSKLLPIEEEKKQGVRLQKLICSNVEHEEPIIIRATKKVTDQGTLRCFCEQEFEIEKKEEE